MILDANTTAKMIRHTIWTLKNKNAMYDHEPSRSILFAFEELARSFDLITGSANVYEPMKGGGAGAKADAIGAGSAGTTDTVIPGSGGNSEDASGENVSNEIARS